MGGTILSVQEINISKSETANYTVNGPIVHYDAQTGIFIVIGRVKNAIVTNGYTGWQAPANLDGSTGFTIEYAGLKPPLDTDELYIFTVQAGYSLNTHVTVKVNEQYHSGPKIDEQPRRKTKIIVTQPS